MHLVRPGAAVVFSLLGLMLGNFVEAVKVEFRERGEGGSGREVLDAVVVGEVTAGTFDEVDAGGRATGKLFRHGDWCREENKNKN